LGTVINSKLNGNKMTRYAAFLRGINVSGQKIIKMERLKEIFESMKVKNVKTYIQSGNVIFDSSESNSETLINKIESHIKKSLGYEVTVITRTAAEIEKVITQNPFAKKKLDKDYNLYITFLAEEPTDALKKSLMESRDEIANYKIINREVYTLYKRSNAKHPFSNNFVEKKLKVAATTRNWNVVNKIYELGKG